MNRTIQITDKGIIADIRLEEYRAKRENWYNNMIKNQKDITEIKKIMDERNKWRASFADYMAYYRRN